MEQHPFADAGDGQRLPAIAVLAEIVGGARRRDPLGPHRIAVAGGENPAVDRASLDLSQPHIHAASQTALVLHAGMPQLLAVVEEVVQTPRDDARPVTDVPNIARTEQAEVLAKVVAIGGG